MLTQEEEAYEEALRRILENIRAETTLMRTAEAKPMCPVANPERSFFKWLCQLLSFFPVPPKYPPVTLALTLLEAHGASILASVLPGLENFSATRVAEFTPSAWAVRY